MAQQRRNGSDFNPDELVQASGEHARNIEELRNQLQNIQSYVYPLYSQENFASYFTQVITSSKQMDTAVADVLKDLIENNKDVKEALKKEVANTDRDWLKQALKRVGFVFWTLLTALISGGAVFLIKG